MRSGTLACCSAASALPGATYSVSCRSKISHVLPTPTGSAAPNAIFMCGENPWLIANGKRARRTVRSSV